jgi:hypothetical protein
MKIKRVSDSGLERMRTHYQEIKVTEKKVAYIRDYPGVVLQVGRETVTAIWAQPKLDGVKEHVLVERETMREVEEALTVRVEEIRGRLDSALVAFVQMFGLGLDEKPGIVWARYEDFIKGESYVDSLPREVVIHDTVFKKVYAEGIEFTQSGEREPPGVRVKNYIKNRALEDLSPELVEAFGRLCEAVRPAEVLMARVRVFPDDFVREDVRRLWDVCTAREREEIEEWAFREFGHETSAKQAVWVRMGSYVRWVCGRCGSSNVPEYVQCRACGVGCRPPGEDV